MLYPSRHALLLVGTCLLLGACASGSVKETLGISRRAPDEFTVLPRPALSVPPQFNLRPPALPGDDTTVDTMPASKQAESIVLGNGGGKNAKGDTFKVKDAAATGATPAAPTTGKKSSGGTSAESQFLSNAGADKANPKVRTEIANEGIVAQPDEDTSSWWNPFGSISSTKKDPIVSPGKEVDRIKTNKAEGKPVNTGTTPEDKQRDRGVLGRILGDD